MSRFLHRFSQYASNATDATYRQLTAVFSISAGILALLDMLIGPLVQNEYTHPLAAVSVLVTAVVSLGLLHRGHSVAARMVLLMGLMLVITLVMISQVVPGGMHLLQIVLLMMPFLLFAHTERRALLWVVAVDLVCIVLALILKGVALPGFRLSLTGDVLLVVCTAQAAALVIIMLSFQRVMNERLATERDANLREIHVRNAQLAQNEEAMHQQIEESQAQRDQMADTLAQLQHAQQQAAEQAEQLAVNETELRSALADMNRKREMDQRLERYSRLLRWHPGQTLNQWGAALLQEMARDFRGAQATLYTVGETDDATRPELRLVASYATSKDVAQVIPFGQGLAGQVVKSGRAYYFDRSHLLRATTPAGMLMLKPKADFLLPLMYNDQVQGLLELCTLVPMDETERQFLHTIGDQFGMALSSISSQQRIEALLADATTKTRILQAQELEMRQNIVQLELTQQQMREFQQQLEVANNSLEQRVADRTKALEVAMTELQSVQNQVVLSEKMAALGQLVAGVAHEMNSPLGAIKASAVNMSDLLPSALRLIPELNQILDDSQRSLLSLLVETILAPREHLSSKEERKLRRQFAQELNDAGVQQDTDDMARRIVDAGFYTELAPYMPLFTSGHGTAIADMLYSLGQLKLNLDNISLAAEKTKKVVFALKSYTHTSEKHELTPTNLKEHIETVLVIYNNQLKYGIEVESHYPEDLPPVMTYSDELSQVWTNIVQNAIQAMNGVGNLRIEVTNDEANAFVRIIDSGPGIPPDKIEKIFEPFFTTKSRGEGTGLGLDIVRKIVRKHHGEISVESVPGRTCFIVRLPLAGQQAAALVPETAEAVLA